jgi:hypothetical protein
MANSTIATGTADPTRPSECTPGFCGVRDAQSWVFWVVLLQIIVRLSILFVSSLILYAPLRFTDRHDITEILLKVALNTIKQTNKRLTDSVYHFGIFSLFLNIKNKFRQWKSLIQMLIRWFFSYEMYYYTIICYDKINSYSFQHMLWVIITFTVYYKSAKCIKLLRAWSFYQFKCQ